MQDSRDISRSQKWAFGAILTILWAVPGIVVFAEVSKQADILLRPDPNPYILMPLFSLVTNVLLLVLVRRAKIGGATGMWFSVFLSCIIMWALLATLSRSASSGEMYNFWWGLSSIAVVMASPLFLRFTLAYTGNLSLLNRWITMSTTVLSASALVFFNGQGDLLWRLDSEALRLSQAYAPDSGPYFTLLTIYFETIYLYCFYLIVRHYRAQPRGIVRTQAGLFVVAASIPIVGATITDLVLPLLDIHLISYALMFITFECIILGYAILRYRLFDFDPVAVGAAMVESVAEGLVFVDSQYRIVQLNHAGAQLLGVSAKTVIGTDWRHHAKLYHGSERKHISAALRPDNPKTLGESARRITGEDDIYIGRQADTAIPVSMTMTRLSGDGVVIAFRDITKDKQATNAIERAVHERTHELNTAQTQLVASINSLRQGFVVTDAHGASILSNQMARRLFHTGGGVFSMQTIYESIGAVADIEKTVLHVIENKRARTLHNVAFHERFLSFYIAPIVQHEHAIGATLLIEDVTEARILDRSKDEFFSIASHELRTPLTAIRGNTKMISELYSDEISDPSVMAMIKDIHESSVRLIEIVNDFLDVSRLEQGKALYKLEPFQLDKAVEIVAYEMTAVAKLRGITLTLDKTLLGSIPPVYADQNRVKQILYNLAGNAIKFTDKGSITISAQVTKRTAKILVRDTGRGIPAKNQALLFRKFQQAGESLYTRDTTKGTGLGLYICKLLADAMGGTVTLEHSQPNHGSTFSVTLPLATHEQLKNQKVAPVEKTVTDSEHREVLAADFASDQF